MVVEQYGVIFAVVLVANVSGTNKNEVIGYYTAPRDVTAMFRTKTIATERRIKCVRFMTMCGVRFERVATASYENIGNDRVLAINPVRLG